MTDATNTRTPATDALAAARKALADAEAAVLAQEAANKEALAAEQLLVDRRKRLVAAQAAHLVHKAHYEALFAEIVKLLPDAGLVLVDIPPAVNSSTRSYDHMLGRLRIDRPDGKLYIGSCTLELRDRYTGNAWRRVSSGERQFTIGTYGDKRTFPQKADKTFSYGKIAKEFANRYNAHFAEKAREAQAHAAATGSRALITGMNIPAECKQLYQSGPVHVHNSARDGAKVTVTVKFDIELGAPEAEVLTRGILALIESARK